MAGLTKKQDPAHDGFYWEEYRNGSLVASGWHAGEDLGNSDYAESFKTDWIKPKPIRGRILAHGKPRR